MTRPTTPAASPPPVRCAIYTRKSTEEGLRKEFTSLDAQRQAAEAYIRSQQQAGWRCLPERYDDGGFTGANLDRPALKRLLADIQAQKLDCVVVHKLDRLSRSLLDFAKLMQILDQHRVAFVSVTQLFNTATSMGRLVLHILSSFAQFERELITERTRDKIAAARRKGKWVGGMPLLGYDVDPQGSKLTVNEAEAERVRAIFTLYVEYQALLPVVQELNRRGWFQKRWRTRQGHLRGGRPFTTTRLKKLLTNVTYRGQIRYHHEIHPGEHPALVDAPVWEQVQSLLRQPAASGRRARNPWGSLLQGILRCVPCGSAMTATQTSKGARCYRYYVCAAAQKNGWRTCPAPSVPAGTIEQMVLKQLHHLDPEGFASLWPSQTPGEQARLVQRLVERVDYDRIQGKLAITFSADHSAILAEEQARAQKETKP